MFLSVAIAWLGVGHPFTVVGRRHWRIVFRKYYIFLCACVGIWTNETVDSYGLEDIAETIFIDNDHEANYTKLLYICVGIRAILFQLTPSLTFFSVIVSSLAGSPLFVVSDKLRCKLPALFVFHSWERAMEQEVHVHGNTDVQLTHWVLYLRCVIILLGESRFLSFISNFLTVCLSFLVLIYSKETQAFIILVLTLLFPFALAKAFIVIIFLGKSLELKDQDFQSFFQTITCGLYSYVHFPSISGCVWNPSNAVVPTGMMDGSPVSPIEKEIAADNNDDGNENDDDNDMASATSVCSFQSFADVKESYKVMKRFKKGECDSTGSDERSSDDDDDDDDDDRDSTRSDCESQNESHSQDYQGGEYKHDSESERGNETESDASHFSSKEDETSRRDSGVDMDSDGCESSNVDLERDKKRIRYRDDRKMVSLYSYHEVIERSDHGSDGSNDEEHTTDSNPSFHSLPISREASPTLTESEFLPLSSKVAISSLWKPSSLSASLEILVHTSSDVVMERQDELKTNHDAEEIQVVLMFEEQIVMIDEDGQVIPAHEQQWNHEEYEYEVVEEEIVDEETVLQDALRAYDDHRDVEGRYDSWIEKEYMESIENKTTASLAASEESVSNIISHAKFDNKHKAILQDEAEEDVEVLVIDEDGNIIPNADLHDDNYEYEEMSVDELTRTNMHK
jgi:hypothetical protein